MNLRLDSYTFALIINHQYKYFRKLPHDQLQLH